MSRTRPSTLGVLVLTLIACSDSKPATEDPPGDPFTLTTRCRAIPAMAEVHWSPYTHEVGVGFGAGSTGLYVTHDGGQSWRRVPYGWSTEFPSAASGFTPSQVVFLDREHWAITGAITRGAQANLPIISRVLLTRDEGQTFVPIFEGSDDTTEVAYPREDAIRPFGQASDGVFRIDEQRLVALARGLLFGSADNGATFHRVRRFWVWYPDEPVPGLWSSEAIHWEVIGDDGFGVVVDTYQGVAVTRDAGVTFEQVHTGQVRRAWLDPLGRVITVATGNLNRGLEVFERRDGVWYQGRIDSPAGRVTEILRFEPDGSFLARLEDRAPLTLSYFEVDGDDYTTREVQVDAGVPLTDASPWTAAVGKIRALARGSVSSWAETRLLCELGETPTPLPEAGVPTDLAPGEIATLAHRHDASGSWDRMAFDAAGHVYVASRRALWGGVAGAPLFLGGQKAPADWRPNAETAEFPEVSGVAVMTDGTIAFGLNFFVGRTARRVLFIDPTSGEVLRWRELAPFDDGVGGYSDGDIFRLTAMGELVFAATGLGTADLTASATLGPGQLTVGLPGLGVPRDDGAYYYLTARRPFDGQHTLGRLSLFNGALPTGACDACIGYPGLIQSFAVAPSDGDDGDDLVFVLDRQRGEVHMRPFSTDGSRGWQLVARGFFDPADIAVREDASGRYVAVLDGDVFAFRPDPEAVAVRGLSLRGGPGEVLPATPRAQINIACLDGAPCIEAVNYLPADDPLAGWVLLDPIDEGRFCFKGAALGADEGTIWFADTPATVTLWQEQQVCGRVDPSELFDDLVEIETAGGQRSNALPFVAPARDPVFRLRADRPMQTGDLVHIEAENLGTVGHAIIGGTILEVGNERLSVLIDATFGGRMTFRKRPSTAIWWRDIGVFPSELAGGIAGPHELGGVSGHLGHGATWTLNDSVLASGPTGDWFEDLPLGDHTLRATYNGRTREVEVAKVAWDTHHHGPLHPDRVALAPHRQHHATLAGQAFTMVRTSGWQRPGGPTGQLVPGIAEVVAFASKPREGQGPFIPGQAFDRDARFGELDEDYDRSRDMPRTLTHTDAVFTAARAVEMDIEPDNQGVPTVTSFREVIPVTARLTRHRHNDDTLTSESLGEVRSDMDEGRIAGLGAMGETMWVAFSDGSVTRVFGGASDSPMNWTRLGEVTGDWEVRTLGEGLLFVRPGPEPAMRRGHFVDETFVTDDLSLSLDEVAATDLMVWRVEGTRPLFALRMADGSERVAELDTELVEVARVDASLPGFGATYVVNGHTTYGVADVIRHDGELYAALAGGESESRKGLWVARLGDSTLTRELASVEVDTIRCLGPYPRTPGSCGDGASPNTQGCTYFACPELERMWLPQEGGAVEVARLAGDEDGLQVTYAVRFPEGWNRDLLDRGRIRTAVFVAAPFGPGRD